MLPAVLWLLVRQKGECCQGCRGCWFVHSVRWKEGSESEGEGQRTEDSGGTERGRGGD